MTFFFVFVLALPVLLMIASLVYSYIRRNDPLSWDEAVRQLEANDCCTCTMCVSAHVKWGKR